MDFQPLLILAVIWLLIGLPLSKLSRVAKQQQAKNAKPGVAKQKQAGAKAPEQKPENSTYVAPEPVRPSVLQPTITFTEHDDSVYQGSMNAITGEGYDPCHDEQLAPLTRAETAPVAAAEAAPGLQLSFTGSEVVRGFVMSEILTRKQ